MALNDQLYFFPKFFVPFVYFVVKKSLQEPANDAAQPPPLEHLSTYAPVRGRRNADRVTRL